MFDIPKKEHYQDHPTKRISLYLMIQVVLMKICTAGMGFTNEFCNTLGSIDTSFGELYLCRIRVKHLTRLGHFCMHVIFFIKKNAGHDGDMRTRVIEYPFTRQMEHSCSE